MSPRPDPEELLDQGEAHAWKILIERREKSLTPLFHLISRDGQHDVVLATPFTGGEIGKQLALLGVRQMAEQIDAVAMVHVSEAWLVTFKNDTRSASRRLATMDPPSQSPDRIETVLIAASNGVEKRMRVLQMIRDKPQGGRVISLVRMAEPTGMDVAGRLFDVLPRRETEEG